MNTRIFKIEELQKLNFAQLLMLREGLKETHPNNMQAWIELDEWMEGYVYKNANNLNAELQAGIREVILQANKNNGIQDSGEEKPLSSVLPEATVSQLGLFASPQPAKAEKQSEQKAQDEKEDGKEEKAKRKSVLEEFFEEQENSWCPIM